MSSPRPSASGMPPDETSDFETLERIVATFAPQRTDDLRPDFSLPVGYRGEWEALWVIERGPYEGQWCFWPTDRRSGWVPLCDLADVERRTLPAHPPEPPAVPSGVKT